MSKFFCDSGSRCRAGCRPFSYFFRHLCPISSFMALVEAGMGMAIMAISDDLIYVMVMAALCFTNAITIPISLISKDKHWTRRGGLYWELIVLAHRFAVGIYALVDLIEISNMQLPSVIHMIADVYFIHIMMVYTMAIIFRCMNPFKPMCMTSDMIAPDIQQTV